MSNKLIIHSRTFSNRLHYIVSQLFVLWYDFQVDFVEDENVNSTEYLIYNEQGLLLCSSNSKILFSDNIQSDFIFDWDKILNMDFNTDWLGAMFFLLSRMEEYESLKDSHGRFSHKNSIAFQKGFLKEPIIDQVVKHFISINFPAKNDNTLTSNVIPTLDIDITHAVLGRNIKRQIGAFLKDFFKGNLKERIKILSGQQTDPYDNFDYQIEVSQRLNVTIQYFFQVGTYGKYDKNISPKHKIFKQVVSKLKNQKLGLHPSYNSMEQVQLFIKEKDILEETSGRKITVSRQHFLRFNLPITYRELIKIGIKEEHSMGYSETIGFRAGTSKNFYWFDLEQNIVTELLVIPFSVMDVALEYYQKLSVEQAINEIRSMKQKIKAVKGNFAFCFHNESLCEQNQWVGWRSVFEEACKQ